MSLRLRRRRDGMTPFGWPEQGLWVETAADGVPRFRPQFARLTRVACGYDTGTTTTSWPLASVAMPRLNAVVVFV